MDVMPNADVIEVFGSKRARKEQVVKLDRDINDDGLGKYAVINLRKLQELCGNPSTFEWWTPGVAQALKTLEEVGALEWGRTGEQDEFFLIKLKDKYAKHTLEQYAAAVGCEDEEYSQAVWELATGGQEQPILQGARLMMLNWSKSLPSRKEEMV